jgi:hypothetical protein
MLHLWFVLLIPFLFIQFRTVMLRWITSLFGSQPHPQASEALHTHFEGSLDQKNWPDGPQLRKKVRYCEPDGWAHSNWVWRSNGYVDHPGSLHPKIDKAECRHCLGVFQCSTCDKLVRPNTKTKDMAAQLARDCPECTGKLQWITCNARTYHFVIEEDGAQYSIWEHSGSHPHPRPPAGRRPPRSVPMPPVPHVPMNPPRPRSEPSAAARKVNASIKGLLNPTTFPF